MRLLIALLSAFTFSLCAFAQNALFMSFDMTYEAIHQELQDNSRISIRPESNEEKIVIDYDGGTFAYTFHFGRLYLIESHKVYTQSSWAEKFYEGSLRYFDRMRSEKLYEEKQGDDVHHVVAAQGKVFQLHYVGEKELTLSAKFVDHAPLYEMNKYEFLAANPFDKVVQEMYDERNSQDRKTFTSFRK